MHLCFVDNVMPIKVNGNISITSENQRIIDFNIINELCRTTCCNQCFQRLHVLDVDQVNVIVRLIENRDNLNIEDHL